MPKRPTLKDLKGLRSWALAIQRWQNDGAQTLAQHGLSWGGFDTLLVLLDGPLRPGEVTDRISFTTGGMAKLLKILEDDGLLVRRRGGYTDLRAVTVELTPAGKQKARDAGADVLAIRDFDYREWEISAESQQSLTQAWERLAEGANG
jgi:DNA-binding MarR family transcriptional regulator